MAADRRPVRPDLGPAGVPPHDRLLSGAGARRALTLLPLLALLALLAGLWLTSPTNASGDTYALARGAKAALHCLEHGHVYRCGTAPAPTYSTVQPFAAAQYVPALVLVAAGAGETGVVRGLSFVNLLAFGVLLAVAWSLAVRFGGAPWGPTVTAVLLASPLLYYSTSSFGEMLAAALTIVFLGTVLTGRHPAAIASSFVLAGITKETAPVFLLALGLIALQARRGPGSSSLKPHRALGIGFATSVALNAGFNLFRYGTLLNRQYLGIFD
jgi:hypothetical protein